MEEKEKEALWKLRGAELTNWLCKATTEQLQALSGREFARLVYTLCVEETRMEEQTELPEAMKRIIEEMAEERRQDEKIMQEKDWVWLLCLLAECTPAVPEDVLEGWTAGASNSESADEDKKRDKKNDEDREDKKNTQVHELHGLKMILPRLNKMHIVDSGLFLRVVYKFWPEEVISSAVDKLRHGNFDTSLYKTGLAEAESPLVLFSCDWSMTRLAYDAQLAVKMIATSLACVKTAIEKSSEEELPKVVKIYSDVAERVVLTFHSALIDEAETKRTVLTAVRELLHKAVKRKKALADVVGLAERAALCLRVKPAEQCELLGEMLWTTIRELITELLKDANDQHDPAASALAIAEESEEEEDLHVKGDWIEQLMRIVPAAMDEKHALQSEIGHLLLALSTRIVHFLHIGQHATSGTHMLHLLEKFYLKICADTDCKEITQQMEKTYAELCRRGVVPSEHTERVLLSLLDDEAASSGHANFCDLVTALIGFAHADTRPALAQLVLEQYFEVLAVKHASLNMASVHIERKIVHLAGKDYAIKLARNIVYFLAPLELGDEETEQRNRQLLVLLDALLNGGGQDCCRVDAFQLSALTSVKCTCTLRNFEQIGEPWTLTLQDLDLKEAAWEEFCESVCRRVAHSQLNAAVLPVFPSAFLSQPSFEHLLFVSQLLRDFQRSHLRNRYLNFYGQSEKAKEFVKSVNTREFATETIKNCVEAIQTAMEKGTWREYEKAMATTLSSWMGALIGENRDLRAPLRGLVDTIGRQIVIETVGQSHPSAAALIGSSEQSFERLFSLCQLRNSPLLLDMHKESPAANIEGIIATALGELDNSRTNGVVMQLKQMQALVAEALIKTWEEEELKQSWRDAEGRPTEGKGHFWLAGVASSIVHGSTASKAANSILTTIDKSSLFMDYTQSLLLKNALLAVPPQKFEILSLRDLFCKLYFDVLLYFEGCSWAKADEDSIVHSFERWLSECASSPLYSLSESFIFYFSSFLSPVPSSDSPPAPSPAHTPSTASSLRDRLSLIFSQQLQSSLSQWISRSDCPTSLINTFQPLFDVLLNKGLLSWSSLVSCLAPCLPLVFTLDMASSAARAIQLFLQQSEKSLTATLDWRSSQPHSSHSDRSLSSITSLSYYNERDFLSPRRHIEGHEHFLTTIRLFCKFANSEMQLKLLEFATAHLTKHMKIDDGLLKVISGERLAEQADHVHIFELMLVFSLMEYVNGVLGRVNRRATATTSDKAYFSDSEHVKASLVRKGSLAMSSTVRRAVHSSSSLSSVPTLSSSVSRSGNSALPPSTSGSSLPLCTYSTTQEDFVNQHWYNCYTCNMVDTVGVCTVCAVNCHRGHDLSYSKRGSFFCDCGHARCASMTSTAHAPNASNAAVGRTPPSQPPTQALFPAQNEFLFSPDFDLEPKHIEPFTKQITEELTKADGLTLQNLATACQKGNNLRWRSEGRRTAVLQAMCKGSTLQVESDGPLIMEQSELKLSELRALLDAKAGHSVVGANASASASTTLTINESVVNATARQSSSDRARARDISAIVQLSELALVWTFIADCSTQLSLLLPQLSTDLTESLQNGRMAEETLGFSATRISVCGRRLAVSGVQDVLIASVNDDGELIEKSLIRINDSPPLGAPPIHGTANAIVRCAWACNSQCSLLALATSQFIRIYDVSLDTKNHLEELVLPLGNIEDVQLVYRGQTKTKEQSIWALVLSSTGLFYEHQVTQTRPLNASYFLTNTISCHSGSNQLPPHGQAVSIFHSSTYNVVFLSFEKTTFVAPFPDEPSNESKWKFTKLPLQSAVNCWQESSGVISGLSHPTANHLIFLNVSETGKFNVQTVSLGRTAAGHQLFTPSTRHTITSLVIFPDSPVFSVHQLLWHKQADLWIEGCPLVSHKVVEQSEESSAEALPREDLLPLLEKCEVVSRVEVSSPVLQQLYSTEDLLARLHSPGANPVVSVQVEEFDITFRVLEPVVVRALRIEVPAANGPQEVVIHGINRTVLLNTNAKRFFDICFTRQESLAIDNRSLRLTFRHRQLVTYHTVSIVSLRLYAISAKEFGASRMQRLCRPPCSLPDLTLRAYLHLLSRIFSSATAPAPLHRLVEQQLSIKSSHCDVLQAARHLLRTITRNRIEYYTLKDGYLMSELKSLLDSGLRLPPDLLLPIISNLKLMMFTRWRIFDSLVSKVFGSVVPLVQHLIEQLPTSPSQAPASLLSLLEVTLSLIFVYISYGDAASSRLVEIYFELFSRSSNSIVAQKIRHLTQVMVYSCSLAARDERLVQRACKETKQSQQQLGMLKFPALRPFYEKTRLLGPDDSREDVEELMGEITNSKEEDVSEKDLSWMNFLLTAILHKINTEITLNSSLEGLLLGKSECVPSSSLVLIAIVIMSNLGPSKLLPHIQYMIRCIDWHQQQSKTEMKEGREGVEEEGKGGREATKSPLTEISDVNYRQLLFLRIISVLLSKFSERLEPKKKLNLVEGRATSIEPELQVEILATSTPMTTPGAETSLASSSSTLAQAEENAVISIKRKQISDMLQEVAGSLLEKDALNFFLRIAQYVTPLWRQGKIALPKREQNEGDAEGGGQNRPGEEDEQCRTHYMHMLTDVALRLPAQLKKINKDLELDAQWQKVACEMQTMRGQPSLIKYGKKLLSAMCNGDRDKCKLLRDAYKMLQQLESLRRKHASFNGAQNHEQLTEMVELVASLNALAAQRPATWKSICERNLNWLLQVACSQADALASSLVELLLLAIRHTDEAPAQLADRLLSSTANRSLLRLLVLRYLIGREPEQRWLLHRMLRSTIQLASRSNQLLLIRLLLDIWPTARSLGTQGAQLADLIASYAGRLLTSAELTTLCETEIAAIEGIAKRLEEDGHLETYNLMRSTGFGWNGMLLEMSPCLSCFSLPSNAELHKLMNIKHDVRFASNAMMFKLSSHYEISKLVIRLSDIKRGKGIKKIAVYYCARNVESAVELKTHRELWQKVASAAVDPNEAEISLSLAVPVLTSSLVIQFPELYEARTPPTELHCPRCSTPVTSNPGVCEHCGENVYQCIKCRAINYDEREPFLCQGCGFCKFARIDISAICRQIPGVQPITTDAERTQCVNEMSRLLVGIEQTRAQLRAQRLLVESLWLRARPLPPVQMRLESPAVVETILGQQNIALGSLNPYQAPVAAIHSVLNSCQLTNQELRVQTQQLVAQREQLRLYDRTDSSPPLLHDSFNQGFYSTSEHCFGCLSAAVLHSLCLVRSALDDSSVLSSLIHSHSIFNLLSRLHKLEPMSEETEQLLVFLGACSRESSDRLCALVASTQLPASLLAKSILNEEDLNWENKFRVLIKLAIQRKEPETSIHAFTVMNKLLKEALYLRNCVYLKIRKASETGGNKKHEKSLKVSDLPANLPLSNSLLESPEKFSKWLLEENTVLSVDQTVFASSLKQWLTSSLFSPCEFLRSAACSFLVNAARHPGHSGLALHLVSSALPQACSSSSLLSSTLLQSLHSLFTLSPSIRVRLFLNNAHVWLINAISRECRLIYVEERDESSTSHWFGTNLCHYTELLSVLLTGSNMDSLLLKTSLSQLLKPLLQSTILLKRIVLHRSRSTDSARLSLESLLHRLSARDPLVLIQAAVESIDDFSDMPTHAHVISIILDVMDPEQSEEEDFLIQIEKDVAQEDFLQGRMTGNPYKSTDAGMGPLMREVKNRICRDTEMIALLDDDNGMELLVNNYIISLSLTVRQVYEKLWKKNHPGQPMVIVYRMRGLLGDAQETFISSFGETTAEEENEDEKLCRAVSCLTECGGMDKAMELMQRADRSGWGRQLLSQLRKLMDKAARTRRGRMEMIQRDALRQFLRVFHLCIEPEPTDEFVIQQAKSYIELCSAILKDLNIHKHLKGINKEEAGWLAKVVLGTELSDKGWARKFDRGSAQLLRLCLQTVSGLVLGNAEAETVLSEQYKIRAARLNDVDNDQCKEKEALIVELDRLATVAEAIPHSPAGSQFKDKLLSTGIVTQACRCLHTHPSLYSATESPEWKLYLARPSVNLILKLLHGLAKGHTATQKEMADKETLAILHRLEQVASENSVGTLAENVVEALKENEEVAAQIEKVREETKKKRKEMAMAMRMKQLSKMGMAVGKQGEVKVTSRKVASEHLADEVTDPLAVCCICRENIFTGKKVAAVYAFCGMAEGRTRYSVSQMVMVHMDCHANAIRRGVGGRSVDEWHKAALHNAGARCNMLTPLAIGNASEAEWLNAVERLKKNLEDALQVSPHLNRQFFYSDMCQIVDRFVFRRSFSDQAQGGGRESNVQYLAVLHLLALSFPPDDSSLTSNEPRHRLVSFLLTEHSLRSWEEQSQDILVASLRDASDPSTPNSFANLKSLCLTWAFVNNYFKSVIPIPEEAEREEWLRANLLSTLHRSCDFVRDFDSLLLPIDTPAEFIDYFQLPVEEMSGLFAAGDQ